MDTLRLSLATLPELERGTVALAFDGELMRAERDCIDRPAEEKPREILLSVKVWPNRRVDGSLDGVNVQVFVKGRTPERRSDELRMQCGRDGIVFNPDNLVDDHPTLYSEGTNERNGR